MKKILLVLLVMLFVTSIAFAEEKHFAIRTGVLWQSGNGSPSQSDYTIGGEYTFPGNYSTGKFSVTADYIGAKKADNNSETLIPVMVNYKWQGIENFTVTVGLGLFAAGGKNFGFQGIGTLPLPNDWFIEGRYIGRTNTTGSPNSFYGAEIGYKF